MIKTIKLCGLFGNTKLNFSHSYFFRLIFPILFVCFSLPAIAQISRTQIINNAVPYTTATWTATSANIWSSVSCGGKTINTPSWVKIGSNTGMPYCWGGWTTTSNIQGYLNSGKSAGDNNTSVGFGAEPGCAVGLDCSGFVSRAWGLTSKYSTSSLPSISTAINLTQTQPGDILNLASSHVRLITTNYGNGNYEVIEASGKDWKTTYRTYTASQLTSYTPRIYNNISGGPGSFKLTVAQGCDGLSNKLILEWTPSSGADSYDIYRNGSLYSSGITGLQYSDNSNLTIGTSYSYYVQAKNSNGIMNSNTASGIAPNCAASITITSPNGREIWQVGTTHLITWTSSSVTGPLHITLYNNGVSQNIIEPAASDTGSYNWTIPLNYTLSSNCKISIMAMNGTVSDFSDSNFSIAVFPPTTTTTKATEITNNSALSGGEITSDGGGFVSARGVCWSTGSNPTTIDSFSIDGEGTGSFISNLTGLSPNTNYYYRAFSINLGGTGYGDILSFTTNVTGIKDAVNIPRAYILNNNYPNPFNPTTLITYAVPTESYVKIIIYNILGRVLEVPEDNFVSAGWHNFTFNGNNLSSGIYFCSIQAVSKDGKQNYTHTTKMVLMK